MKNLKRYSTAWVLALAFIFGFFAPMMSQAKAPKPQETMFVSNLRVTGNGGQDLTVRWDPAPGADGYYIFRMHDGERVMPYIGYTMKGNAFTDKGARAGFNFYRVIPFKIEADKSQTPGVSQKYVYGWTAPAGIKNLSVKELSGAKVALSWPSVPGATHYKILRKDSTVKGPFTQISIVSRTRFTDDSTKKNGEWYTYCVQPVVRTRGMELSSMLQDIKTLKITKASLTNENTSESTTRPSVTPTEPKPTEPKPTEPKPVEPKPTEPTKPTVPSQPSEPKPSVPKPSTPKDPEPTPEAPKPSKPTKPSEDEVFDPDKADEVLPDEIIVDVPVGPGENDPDPELPDEIIWD